VQKINKYTREEKLKLLGEGEWCDERDQVNFEWADMKCEILKIKKNFLIFLKA
jgi:hypothetical protein